MEHHCELIDGIFSILVQIALGCVALSALLVKRRFFENPKRPKIVWIVDTFKQIAGQLFAHALNIGIAYVLAQKTSGTENNDKCMWYLINYLFDTILGTGICFIFVRIQNLISAKCNIVRIRSGNYIIHYTDHLTLTQSFQIACQCILQIFLWFLVILLTKTLIFCLILLPLHEYLQQFGDMIVRPMIDHPQIELVVVMIIVPMILNICQFWIQDLFLKDKQTGDQGILDVDFTTLNNAQSDENDNESKVILTPIMEHSAHQSHAISNITLSSYKPSEKILLNESDAYYMQIDQRN